MVLKTGTVHADYYSMFTMTQTKGYAVGSIQCKDRSNMIRCLGPCNVTAFEHVDVLLGAKQHKYLNIDNQHVLGTCGLWQRSLLVSTVS